MPALRPNEHEFDASAVLPVPQATGVKVAVLIHTSVETYIELELHVGHRSTCSIIPVFVGIQLRTVSGLCRCEMHLLLPVAKNRKGALVFSRTDVSMKHCVVMLQSLTSLRVNID